MRLVLDTNVLIAAFVARGVCHELLEHCERQHEIISSEALLEEFESTLVRKFKVPRKEAQRARVLLQSRVELVVPALLDSAVSRDPDDDRVLATAVAGGCVCIITGDKDLLVLDPFLRIRIMQPSAFWAHEASLEASE